MPQETQFEMEAVVLHPETERKFTKLTSIKDVRRKEGSVGKNRYAPDMLADVDSEKAKLSPKRKMDEGSSFLIRTAIDGVNASATLTTRTKLAWYENSTTLALLGFGSVLAAGLLTLLIGLAIRG